MNIILLGVRQVLARDFCRYFFSRIYIYIYNIALIVRYIQLFLFLLFVYRNSSNYALVNIKTVFDVL